MDDQDVSLPSLALDGDTTTFLLPFISIGATQDRQSMLACESTGRLASELASALDPEEEPGGLLIVMPGRSLQTTGTRRREACHAMNAQFGARSGPTPPRCAPTREQPTQRLCVCMYRLCLRTLDLPAKQLFAIVFASFLTECKVHYTYCTYLAAPRLSRASRGI